MAQITIKINDKLDGRFRIAIANKLGGRKGDLTIAVEEAIKLWLEKNEE